MREDSWLHNRRSVVLAFWATVLLGIPFWYLTTRVSRAALPDLPIFEDVRPVIPITLDGVSTISSSNVIERLNRLQPSHRYINDATGSGYTISWQDGAESSTIVRPGTRDLTITSTPQQPQDKEKSLITLLMQVFNDETRRIASSKHMASISPDLRVVKYSPRYEIVLSLMNGGGEQSYQSWNVQQVLQSKVEQMMPDLSAIAEFTLESQIQFHADLTFEPTIDSVSGNHVIQVSDLKNFINSAEWNLATAQGQSKPLNFLIYVPKQEHRPLIIMDQGQPLQSNSFILPQFGSIIIHNPSDNSTDFMPEDVLKGLVSKSVQHLLTLLGLPEVPQALGDASRWRLDGLLRQRLAETILSAEETLKSIPKVVDQIPNMHVPGHVATLIEDALESLSLARHSMNDCNVYEALRHSRSAVKAAEEAFFDDKMVSLLYFPDEHKYGVYMPLFGPLLLPLVMAGLRELKVFRDKRRRKMEK